MGEVGLAGEIRQVPGASRRLTEAVRLGFDRAIVPTATPAVPGIELVRVASLGDAIAGVLGSSEVVGGRAPGPAGQVGERASTHSPRELAGLLEVS
jgi:DNA repair protein RadA/Sms